jgi:hypothetical protein
MSKAELIQFLCILGQAILLVAGAILKEHMNIYIKEHKEVVQNAEKQIKLLVGEDNYTKDINYLNNALTELNKDLKSLTMQEVENFAIGINSKVHFTKDETIEEILKIIKEGFKC